MIKETRTDQKYTGIILAGGQSSRMGKEKGLIHWKGKTLVEHAIAILTPLCENIIISANNDHFDSFGYRVVEDLFPGCGPMGGIFSSLKKSETLDNLVIPSDTPFVTTEIYRHLTAHAGSFDVIVPVDHDGFYQPLCAVYSRSVLPAMEAQINDRILGFTPLLNRVETKAVHFDSAMGFYNHNTFYNINSPADLEAIS
jgi:molybdopterin-guanine dinucleotide biosynthesis protein A